jgi:hypothetical protein
MPQSKIDGKTEREKEEKQRRTARYRECTTVQKNEIERCN